MLHEHPAEEADTAKGFQESDSNEIVHVTEQDARVQEVEHLNKEMNASCIGEQISCDEFLGYFNRLARRYCRINLRDKLEDNDLDKQDVVHALYRLRYLKYQFSQQTSEEELLDGKLKSLLDKSEDDCNQEFLEEEGFFRRFEKDMTLDWFFHPDYEECSSLTDYQRLVLQNYYQTCTEAIALGDTEDKARKLIAEAVNTRVSKPKSYEQYIRKKIDIARIIGILPED